jgi:hypothetical protein
MEQCRNHFLNYAPVWETEIWKIAC